MAQLRRLRRVSCYAPAAACHLKRLGQVLRRQHTFSEIDGRTINLLRKCVQSSGPPASSDREAVLIVGGHQGNEILEIWLGLCMHAAGFGVAFLVPGTPKYLFLRSRFDGIFEFDFLRMRTRPHFGPAKQLVRTHKGLSSLAQAKLAEDFTASCAVSSFMRMNATCDFPDYGTELSSNLVYSIVESLGWYETYRHEATKRPVATVIATDPGYSPTGEVLASYRRMGARLVSWNLGPVAESLLLKQSRTRLPSPYSLDVSLWRDLRAYKDRGRLERQGLHALESAYQSAEWFKFDRSSTVGVGSVSRAGFSSATRGGMLTVGIFPHIGWDGSFFWGKDVFGTYDDWFRAVIDVARRKSHVQWIVKMHPAHLTKSGGSADVSHLMSPEILELFNEKPPHVRLLAPDSRLSSLAVLREIDVCLTVRGTIGLEAAALGITTVTAGTGRYDRLGFTCDPESKGEFLEMLEKIDELPRMTESQIADARLFLWSSMFGQGLDLRSAGVATQIHSHESLGLTLPDSCDPLSQNLRRTGTALRSWLDSDSTDFVGSKLYDQ